MNAGLGAGECRLESVQGRIYFMEAVREDGGTAGGTPALRRREEFILWEPGKGIPGYVIF